MPQFAWFVDAGYLYAAGGNLCLGTRDRTKIEIDFGTVTKLFGELGTHRAASERHLRSYWYDGARDGIPTQTHNTIARQPGVKLRLGRTVPRGAGIVQKGVDSLIVRDLIRLSQNRAISTAYLLGGDEDLRQGVVEAQEVGVRVVLVGIEPFGEQNQAATLVREADDVVILGKKELSPHFRPLAVHQPLAGQPQRPAIEVGVELGREWKTGAGAEAVERLRQHRSQQPNQPIPREIDGELLHRASPILGNDIPQTVKIALRQGFLDGALSPEDDEASG